MLACLDLTAQERSRIQPEVGMAYSYVTDKYSNSEFNAKVLPHAGISVIVPVAHGMSLKTGAYYQQKGWDRYSVIKDDSSELRWEFRSTVKFHVLSIPLQLCYVTKGAGDFKYYFAGGISYGFMLSGKEDEELKVYHKDELDQKTDATRKPYIGLVAKDSILKSTYNSTMYYRFSPAVRVDAGMIWRQRYSVQVYWEQSINSISITNQTATALVLGYCGLTLGVNLNKP
jgi:hypothetical protein